MKGNLHDDLQDTSDTATASYSYAAGISTLAKQYVGMSGSCDYISYLLTQAYKGVGGVIGLNTYEISYSGLQPGDLVGYFWSEGEDPYYHPYVSTYLGNGMVLSGNYNGSARIVSLSNTIYPVKRYFRVGDYENFQWYDAWHLYIW